jgi:GH25 family lysozyme M1 (1,4-beta-N-acetylmuramidase)
MSQKILPKILPKILKGHDISYANPNIDFKALKDGGAQFVIIRTGYARRTDTLFHYNIAAATKAGLDVGVYCYARSTNVEDAVKEAHSTLSIIQPYQLTYPVFYDIEDTLLVQQCTTELRTDIAVAFLETVKQAGYYTGIYTNPDWLTNKLDYARLKDYDLWLAAWTQNPDKPTKYDYKQKMWQWGAGVTAGTKAAIDGDLCYVDYPAIIRAGGYNHLAPANPPAAPGDTAQNDETCTFTATEVVNVRIAPCLDGKVLGIMQPGDKVSGVRDVTVENDNFCWQRVDYNDECAWIASEYLEAK